MVSGRTVAAIAAAVIVAAFAGGALSGKLEHTRSALRPSQRVAGSGPTTTVAAPVSPLLSIQAVEADMIADLSLDKSAGRLDPDISRRASLAQSASAVRSRHADVALAWSPALVTEAEAAADAAAMAAASATSGASFTAAIFHVARWGPVTIDGLTAVATCVGHFELVEPVVPAGVVEQPDQTWTVALGLGPTGRWLLRSRAAA